MSFRLCFALLAAIVLTSPHTMHADQLLYLASTKDKTIVAYNVDAQSGKLKQRFSVDLPGNAGPLAFSPDNSFVYAAMTGLKDGKAGVGTLKRAKDGSLKLLDTATINSRAPYIRADATGRYLLAAHYGDGDVTTYRITDGICTDEMLDHKVTEKTAHCIEIDPSGKYAFVPHTAPNKVYQFILDGETGKLIPNDPPSVDGPDKDHMYHAPRHYAHHPTLKMGFTSGEFGGGITSWKFDPKTGKLTRAQTLSTLPPGYEGGSAAADIKITPDGRFAYVSNRDTNKRPEGEAMKDTLCAVSIDTKTGQMKIVGHYATGHFPRSFCIDLTGNFLYAAGQRSDDLFAYRINQKTGALKHVETYETGGVPIWVMCGDVD